MERWANKVALIAGASSGIGLATAVRLVENGLKVVGCARNIEPIEATSDLLSKRKDVKGELHAIRCDLRSEKDITDMFQWIEDKFGGSDILINNAAVLDAKGVLGSPIDTLRTLLDVNVLSVAINTQLFVKSLDKKKNSSEGHIINMNSVAGHRMPYTEFSPTAHFYDVTKNALTCLSEATRIEIQKRTSSQKNIRVTNISPGAVKTDIIVKGFRVDQTAGSETRPNILDILPHLEVEDIADAIITVLSTPPHFQISELTLRNTAALE